MCPECKAYIKYQEMIEKHKHRANPKFQLCCSNGKVQLPLLRTTTSFVKTFM